MWGKNCAVRFMAQSFSQQEVWKKMLAVFRRTCSKIEASWAFVFPRWGVLPWTQLLCSPDEVFYHGHSSWVLHDVLDIRHYLVYLPVFLLSSAIKIIIKWYYGLYFPWDPCIWWLRILQYWPSQDYIIKWYYGLYFPWDPCILTNVMTLLTISMKVDVLYLVLLYTSIKLPYFIMGCNRSI